MILDAWTNSDDAAKRNYLRTIIARYAGFYNVYWEIGNEMAHTNSGPSFKEQAETKYIPWIREFDPYNLPIGLSEIDLGTNTAGVDIIFTHQTTQLPFENQGRAQVMNELVRGGSCGGKLFTDETIRNQCARFSFRRTFWRMFTMGGAGSYEATKLDYSAPLNQAVLDVMNDHKILADFLSELPVDINVLADLSSDHLKGAPANVSSRNLPGLVYISYFLDTSDLESLELILPIGEYTVKWVDPASGETIDAISVKTVGKSVEIEFCRTSEDLVLYIDSNRL